MRKEKSFKNILTNIIPYILLTILSFLRLKILLNKLGIEIYALNQLFIQIFAYISIAEAGVGVLITQLYYKYFVKNNHNKINEIYSKSQQLLQNISIIMFIIGIIISFFLKLLTRNTLSLLYMQIVFIIFLFRSIMEYLMFAPRFVLNADQKAYKINLYINLYKIIEILLEITILQIYQNYIIILITSIIIRFFAYYTANKITFKEYPWLKKINNPKIKISGFKNVITHKIAGTVYNNTDILLISIFLSPLDVTIYSSYNYIIKFISDIIYMFASSITASMGNLIYKESLEKQINVFEKLNSIFIFLAMSISIILYLSINTFIKLWIGEDKIINSSALFFIILTLYMLITIRPFLLIRDAKALYQESKLIAILEAIINISLSIPLIKYFGIIGGVIATFIATLFTTNLFYPIFIYKKIFQTKYYNYFFKIIKSIIISIIICYISNQIPITTQINNYVQWFIFSFINVIIIIPIIFLLNYFFSKNFKNIFNELFYNFLFKIRRKNEKNYF